MYDCDGVMHWRFFIFETYNKLIPNSIFQQTNNCFKLEKLSFEFAHIYKVTSSSRAQACLQPFKNDVKI